MDLQTPAATASKFLTQRVKLLVEQAIFEWIYAQISAQIAKRDLTNRARSLV